MFCLDARSRSREGDAGGGTSVVVLRDRPLRVGAVERSETAPMRSEFTSWNRLQITILHRAGLHRRVRRGMLFQDQR
jgi:hypothetical protein